MRVLSASELLEAWEEGLGQELVARGLTLLAATDPQTPPQTLAKLSIGRRDAGLLSLREGLFGPRLIGVANCPRCGERLELSFTTADIRASSGALPFTQSLVGIDDWQVEFRFPNTEDLLSLDKDKDISAARAQLLQRCILTVEKNREVTPTDDLPENVIDAVVQTMADADGAADVQLALNCPSCRHEWQAPFDIVSFLWSEVNAWAQRILHDVGELARAYGWREADILALSPLRRQVYLEMIS
jgi:hypothetical protein